MSSNDGDGNQVAQTGSIYKTKDNEIEALVVLGKDDKKTVKLRMSDKKEYTFIQKEVLSMG